MATPTAITGLGSSLTSDVLGVFPGVQKITRPTRDVQFAEIDTVADSDYGGFPEQIPLYPKDSDVTLTMIYNKTSFAQLYAGADAVTLHNFTARDVQGSTLLGAGYIKQVTGGDDEKQTPKIFQVILTPQRSWTFTAG